MTEENPLQEEIPTAPLPEEPCKTEAEEYKDKYGKLDVLIKNAGAFFDKNREITEDGFEKTITLTTTSLY